MACKDNVTSQISSTFAKKEGKKKKFYEKDNRSLGKRPGGVISNQHDDATDSTYETKEFVCYSTPTISISSVIPFSSFCMG